MKLSAEKADQWMRVAFAVAEMGTCPRRNVGALILDSFGHILSTGYNGMPRGMTSCGLSQCDGLSMPSGQGLDRCLAVHAEQNALLQCRSIGGARILVTTTSPCIHCIKMLLNTPIEDIVYHDHYHTEPLLLWHDCGRNYGQVQVR